MNILRLYNTKNKQKEPFNPINTNNIRMYVCGPTVYDNAHIGNARPVVVFDTLFRLLRHNYGSDNVIYVRNITDIDDKIIIRANELYPNLEIEEKILKLTKKVTEQFLADTISLNCLSPTQQPRATQYIDKMREMIGDLLDKGYAYIKDDHILFSVDAMNGSTEVPNYGGLSHRVLENMKAGARVEVESYKRSEFDFVLWKPAKEGEPAWESPKGVAKRGRPGWHIECSAMSCATLLEPFGGGINCCDKEKNIFDIHGGGLDLIFPHHENEIAQSCCSLNVEAMANYWLHNGFVQVEGRKMSKSLGNFITISEVLNSELITSLAEKDKQVNNLWNGLSARFSILQTHYREPLNWTQSRLLESSKELYHWYNLLRKSQATRENLQQQYLDKAAEILGDDLASSQLITYLRKAYKEQQFEALLAGMDILGLLSWELLTENGDAIFTTQVDIDESYIEQQISLRQDAIAKKDWEKADSIRKALEEENILLKDYKDPETGERKTSWEVKAL